MKRSFFTAAAALALCATARAESEPCVQPSVGEVLPGPGSEDVPTNARVLVEVRGDLGCFSEEPSFRLTHAGTDLTFTLRSWEQAGGKVYALQPSGPLPEDAELTVEVLGLDGTAGRGELYRFRTGGDPLHPTTEAPRLRVLNARYDSAGGDSTIYEIELEVAPTSDTAPYDLIHLGLDLGGDASDDEADYAVTLRPDPDGWATQTTLVQAGPTTDKVCVVTRQQDIAGQWSEPTRACADTEGVDGLFGMEADDHGCSATPGTTPGWATLLFLPLAIRRRRA